MQLFGAVVTRFYEAIGVVNATNYGVSAPEPITDNIRCAVYNDKMGHGNVAVVAYLVLIL